MQSGKPLGRKAYGSIPHLPGSRTGPGDYTIHEGQARIATIKTRDRHDIVIVQEKLDGSNVSIAKINGALIPLTRSGYTAISSPYEQHHLFHAWVNRHYEMFDSVLNEGERICGEWLAQAHGTRYRLYYEPFVPFDIFDESNKRIDISTFHERTLYAKLPWPTILHRGGAISIEEALYRLGDHGYHGAIDKAEGLVYRIERKGEVDFLAKYVRPDKIDGKYLPEKNGLQKPIWNIIYESKEEVVRIHPYRATGEQE